MALPDMSPITAVIDKAFAEGQGLALLPLGLTIVTHMALGMAWYGTIYGRLFLKLAHGGNLPASADDSKIYSVAMASDVVAYLCFHLVVVATGSQLDVVSLTAIGLAMVALDVAAHLRHPLFEMRPIGLMYMHLMYHAASMTMAVFYYSFLGPASSGPGLASWSDLLHVSPPRIALVAVVWTFFGVLWYGYLFNARFVELAFPDTTQEERQRLLDSDDGAAMNVSNVTGIIVAFVIDRAVAYAGQGPCLGFPTAVLVAAAAALVVMAWGSSLQAIHYGFEHRPIALWVLHQSCHAVAAVSAAVGLVLAHHFVPTWF